MKEREELILLVGYLFGASIVCFTDYFMPWTTKISPLLCGIVLIVLSILTLFVIKFNKKHK